jgi:hypothetical protein
VDINLLGILAVDVNAQWEVMAKCLLDLLATFHGIAGEVVTCFVDVNSSTLLLDADVDINLGSLHIDLDLDLDIVLGEICLETL